MAHSTPYTVFFAATVSVICGVLVAGSAVALKPMQDENKVLDQRKQVIAVAGVPCASTAKTADEISKCFEENIKPTIIDLKTGAIVADVDAATFDMQRAMKDPETSSPAPENGAKVLRLPTHAKIFRIVSGSEVTGLILPVQGYGLWSVLYGFLALEADGDTVKGITFYAHGETPGLGGEVDNPKWKSLWPGRKVYGADGEVALKVIKGSAGTPAAAPHSVDGLSGATITSNGVTKLVNFWLSDEAYGPFLTKFRAGEGRTI